MPGAEGGPHGRRDSPAGATSLRCPARGRLGQRRKGPEEGAFVVHDRASERICCGETRKPDPKA